MHKSTIALLLYTIAFLSPIATQARVPEERSVLKIAEQSSQGELPIEGIHFSYTEVPEYEGHSCSFRAEIAAKSYYARFAEEKWDGLECDCGGTIERWKRRASTSYVSMTKTFKRYTNENHPYQCELDQREEMTLQWDGLELTKETYRRAFVDTSSCPWIY